MGLNHHLFWKWLTIFRIAWWGYVERKALKDYLYTFSSSQLLILPIEEWDGAGSLFVPLPITQKGAKRFSVKMWWTYRIITWVLKCLQYCPKGSFWNNINCMILGDVFILFTIFSFLKELLLKGYIRERFLYSSKIFFFSPLYLVQKKSNYIRNKGSIWSIKLKMSSIQFYFIQYNSISFLSN